MVSGGNCIKIGLAGKLILRSRSHILLKIVSENRFSWKTYFYTIHPWPNRSFLTISAPASKSTLATSMLSNLAAVCRGVYIIVTPSGQTPGGNCIEICLSENWFSVREKVFRKSYSLENSLRESIFRELLFLYNSSLECWDQPLCPGELSGHLCDQTSQPCVMECIHLCCYSVMLCDFTAAMWTYLKSKTEPYNCI